VRRRGRPITDEQSTLFAATASVTWPAQFPKAGTWGQFWQEEEGLRPADNTGTFGRKRLRPSGGHNQDFLKKKVSVRWTIVGLLEFREEDGLHSVDNSGTLRNYGRLRVCPVDNAGRFWSKERRKTPRELRSWVIVVVSASSPKSFLSPQEFPTYHSLLFM